MCLCEKGGKREGKACKSGMWMVFELAVKRVAIWREFHISVDIPSVTKNRLELNYRQLLLWETHRVEWRGGESEKTSVPMDLFFICVWENCERIQSSKKQWCFSCLTRFPIYPLQLKRLAHHQQDFTPSFCCWSEAEVPDLTAQGLNGADRASVLTRHSGVVVLLLSSCNGWNDL